MVVDPFPQSDSFEVVGDSLDILADVLTKFGGLVGGEHARVRAALAPLLDDSRAALRKRALHCMGALSAHKACTCMYGTSSLSLKLRQ